MTPAIFGIAGTQLTPDEAALFGAANPAGYIVFSRNIADPVQLRRLTNSLRDLHGRDDVMVLVDQEGGTVARLRAPHWPEFPSARRFDALYDVAPASATAAVKAQAEAMALCLAPLGINGNCWPLLDVRQHDAHPIIAERSFGADPMRVAAMARAALDGLAAGGVVGVVKHMPGQGRATTDSHIDLPRVRAPTSELESDLHPFRALSHALIGMTAHVVFDAWDAAAPATLSATVIGDVIRGQIGFDGLLMTDGLEMEALSGSMAERAANALNAGVDIALHCSGEFGDMAAIVERIGHGMTPLSLARLKRAMHGCAVTESTDAAALTDALARRDKYLALA